MAEEVDVNILRHFSNLWRQYIAVVIPAATSPWVGDLGVLLNRCESTARH